MPSNQYTKSLGWHDLSTVWECTVINEGYPYLLGLMWLEKITCDKS